MLLCCFNFLFFFNWKLVRNISYVEKLTSTGNVEEKCFHSGRSRIHSCTCDVMSGENLVVFLTRRWSMDVTCAFLLQRSRPSFRLKFWMGRGVARYFVLCCFPLSSSSYDKKSSLHWFASRSSPYFQIGRVFALIFIFNSKKSFEVS